VLEGNELEDNELEDNELEDNEIGGESVISRELNTEEQSVWVLILTYEALTTVGLNRIDASRSYFLVCVFGVCLRDIKLRCCN